jgi:hypothetical protein
MGFPLFQIMVGAVFNVTGAACLFQAVMGWAYRLPVLARMAAVALFDL